MCFYIICDTSSHFLSTFFLTKYKNYDYFSPGTRLHFILHSYIVCKTVIFHVLSSPVRFHFRSSFWFYFVGKRGSGSWFKKTRSSAASLINDSLLIVEYGCNIVTYQSELRTQVQMDISKSCQGYCYKEHIGHVRQGKDMILSPRHYKMVKT